MVVGPLPAAEADAAFELWKKASGLVDIDAADIRIDNPVVGDGPSAATGYVAPDFALSQFRRYPLGGAPGIDGAIRSDRTTPRTCTVRLVTMLRGRRTSHR